MKIRLFFIIAFLPVLLFGQKSQVMLDHYQNEWNNFRDFIDASLDDNADTTIDIKFYHLGIDIGIDNPYLVGNVKCVFQPLIVNLDQLHLDLNSSMNIDSITGPVAGFDHSDDIIQIDLNNTFGPDEIVELSIYYQGVPKLAGGYKGMRYETHGSGHPIIATLSTPYLAHYWYPCKDGPTDKPDSVYVDITIPDTLIGGIELIGISNGLLEETVMNGNKKTFKWRHRYPIVTYYVMAAVSNYEIISENYTGNYGEQYPLDYYVFEETYSQSLAGIADMPLALDAFSELFGIYPFNEEKYGMTELGYYGAIENQTNTIINNMSTGWFMISVHELGHMWFGDMITCANWHHGWLNEGFATYSEALYVESQNGHGAYMDYIDNEQYFYGGTLYLENAQDTFNVFQPIIYSKGSYVLHMLRGVLGDDVFFEGIKSYATDPALMYGNATTEELQAVMESTSGMDLGFFFNQWVYDEYYPKYQYNYENNVFGNSVLLSLKQTQGPSGWRPLFEMPVGIGLELIDGTDTIVTVWNDHEVQTFEFLGMPEVVGITFDPEGWLLDQSVYNPGLPVGVGEVENPVAISVHPIPAKDQINVTVHAFAKPFMITIFNVDGLMMFSGMLDQKTKVIDISSFADGMYFINVVADDGLKVRKFVKY
jgi:aminopeptidase N